MRVIPVLAMALMLGLPAFAETAPATISVTGEGKVEIAPDMATLNLGVTTEADTAAAALKANSDGIAGALSRLKDAGIAERDLQTSGLTLNPRYDYGSSGGEAKITGYIASNMVTVRVRDLAVLGQTLDAVVTDGANTLGGLSFGLQEPDSTMDEARRRAVADATHKATLYAEAAGVKLGRIMSIADQGNYGGPQPMMMAEARFAKDAGSVPVASGELTVGATVAVTYEIAE
jgi:uncharacterized protein